MGRVLSVENVSVSFPGARGDITVVDDVSFTLDAGQSLVIAGESGSGKSMICQTLLGIAPGAANVTVNGIPCVTAVSTCACAWGGIVSVVTPAQQFVSLL